MNTMMKLLMLSFLLLSTSVVAKENTSDASLTKALADYKEIQLSGELGKSLDYVYPPVFSVTPREMLEQSFKMAKEAGKMPTIIAFNVTNNQPLKKYAKGVYVILPYDMEMTMDLTPPVSKENKEEYAKVEAMLADPKKVESYKAFTLNMLKMTMGKGAEVSSDTGSLLVNIKKSSKLLAINEENSSWKFIEADPQAIAPVKSVIPQKIVENEKEIFSAKVLTQEEQMQEMMKMMSK